MHWEVAVSKVYIREECALLWHLTSVAEGCRLRHFKMRKEKKISPTRGISYSVPWEYSARSFGALGMSTQRNHEKNGEKALVLALTTWSGARAPSPLLPRCRSALRSAARYVLNLRRWEAAREAIQCSAQAVAHLRLYSFTHISIGRDDSLETSRFEWGVEFKEMLLE